MRNDQSEFTQDKYESGYFMGEGAFVKALGLFEAAVEGSARFGPVVVLGSGPGAGHRPRPNWVRCSSGPRTYDALLLFGSLDW